MPPLTDANKSLISELYAQKKSIFTIHVETGLGEDSIRKHLKATGQTRHAGQGKPQSLTPEQCAKIYDLRAQGLPWATIALRMGKCAKATVQRGYEFHTTGKVIR